MLSLENKNLVSVIVPIYNVEKYLKNCVDSILSQTYSNIELILVDDGSPDNSPVICDNYKNRDNRVKVIHKKNGGLSSARNAGLEICTGNYIMFVDSDDWIEKDLIERMIAIITNNPVELVTCGKYLDNGTNKKSITSKKSGILSVEEAIKDSIFDEKVGIAAWGKLYCRKIFDHIRFPEGEIHEDVAVIYHIFSECSRIYVLNYPGYYYRYNDGGISKQSYSKKYDIVLKHVLENEEFIINKYPKVALYGSAMVANTCVEMLIKIIRTDDGIINFDEQYHIYRNNLKNRFLIYIFSALLKPKKIMWALIFTFGDRNVSGLFRKIGIYH